MWSWKHGGFLACTLVTTRVHNIDIDNQDVYIYIYASYLHEQRAQDGKHELTASLHLYFTHFNRVASSTILIPAGLSWWPWQTKISWKVTDRQHSDDGYVLFISFFLVCFISHLLIFTCFQTEMNCCHHSWEWSLCIWWILAHQKDRLKYGGLPVWSLSVLGSWFWDTPRRCLRRFLIAVSNGPNFLEYQSVALNLKLEMCFWYCIHFRCLHSRTPFAITVTRCEYPLMSFEYSDAVYFLES